MNVYYQGTGDYLLLQVAKKQGPGNAPLVSITSGITAAIVPTGNPTPTSGYSSITFANGAPAVDISTLAVGTYDIYLKITDPDNPSRFPIEKAGTFQIQ